MKSLIVNVNYGCWIAVCLLLQTACDNDSSQKNLLLDYLTLEELQGGVIGTSSTLIFLSKIGEWHKTYMINGEIIRQDVPQKIDQKAQSCIANLFTTQMWLELPEEIGISTNVNPGIIRIRYDSKIVILNDALNDSIPATNIKKMNETIKMILTGSPCPSEK